MLAIFSAVFGFLAPFLPEVLRLLRGWQEQRFELERLRLSAALAERQQGWRMDEVAVQAEAAELAALHRPQPSFGVQILDRAHDGGLPGWAVTPVFWAFALLDWLAGMVRPALTYAAFGFYCATKAALYATLTGPRFEAGAADAVAQLWGEQDWAVLTLVLSYWFGLRSMKAAFGGNAGHGGAGR